MKKSLFVLTAALSFGVAAAQTAAPATAAPATATPAPASAPQVPALTDVPAGHWAKDAIDRLVSRGIILGYPDGTYRGTQNLTRYEAAVIIARLLDQIRTGDVPMSSITPEDLTALQNAIQELAADLTALGVRVSDLEENAVNRDDFARLEARVEELAAANGDAAAIAGLQTQITELTARADDYDALRADIDDNASSIAALNDLTVLLNQDILNLQDRVSAVESAQADFVQRSDFDNLAGRVGTIDTRVTTLENAPKFSLTGAVTSAYGRIALTSGTQDFDVDRLTNGTFGGSVFGDADVSTTDTTANYSSDLNSLGFGIRASNLTTRTGSFTVNNAVLNFGVGSVFNVNGGPVAVRVNSATADGTIVDHKFNVNYSAYNSLFKFNNYLFNNSEASNQQRRGFVLNVNVNHPLQPTVTVVAGNANGAALTGVTVAADTTAANQAGPTSNYYGVRVAVNPAGLGTVGLSYAQTEAFRTAFGVDYNVKAGPVSLVGEGVISAPNAIGNNFLAGNAQGFFANSNKAFYTEARADLGIARFGANYRTIDPAFAVNATTSVNANAGMSTVDNLYYAPNQTGFGAALGTTLGPVVLGAYGDTYTRRVSTTTDNVTTVTYPRTTGFGVKAGVQLGSLALVGFYNNANVGGTTVDGNNSDYNGSSLNINNRIDASHAAGMGIAGVPFTYTSTVGAQLSHDGSATNALVKGLNFTVADGYYYTSRTNSFAAYANYSGTVAGITLQPLVRYHLVTNPGADVAGREHNTIKYGIKLSTAPMTAIPLQPSAYVNVVNRITNAGTTSGVNNGTTTELLGQVGLSLNQFLVPNATAKVGYSYYQGFNVADTTVGVDDVAFSPSYDRVYSTNGTNSGKVDGIYAQLGYAGLAANYGVFRYTNLAAGADHTPSVGQGFKVSYTFNF